MAKEEEASLKEAIKKDKKQNKSSGTTEKNKNLQSPSGRKHQSSTNFDEQDGISSSKKNKATNELADSNSSENVCKGCKKEYLRLLTHIKKSKCKESYTDKLIEEMENARKTQKNLNMQKYIQNKRKNPEFKENERYIEKISKQDKRKNPEFRENESYIEKISKQDKRNNQEFKENEKI